MTQQPRMMSEMMKEMAERLSMSLEKVLKAGITRPYPKNDGIVLRA